MLQSLQGSRVDRQAGGQIAAHGFTLALAFGDFATQTFQRLGRGGETDAHPRAGGIQHVDGLVRQLPPGQVACRQLGGGRDRIVAQVDTVTLFVDRRQPAQDGDGFRNARLVQLHRLEAPGQRRVLLEIFLVLAPGRRRDGAQLAACQDRLEQVGRIAAAGLATGADQRVRLIDEQDDRLGRAFHLVDHALQTAFEFALHAGAGLQQAEVEAQQLDALECRRHFAGGDAQCQAFDDGSLADPGLANHDRIVLPPPGKDVDHLADRRVAAEHRIELTVAGLLGEIVGKARQVGFATGCRLAVRGLRLLA